MKTKRMLAKAEGRIFGFDGPDKIRADFLEAIAYKGVRQRIQCRTPEFSAVCPFSGLPDLGTVVIDYVPQKKIVELKSLKYYFVSFRNVGITQEEVTSRIFVDLKKLLVPRHLKVEVAYQVRGGIGTACVAEFGRA